MNFDSHFEALSSGEALRLDVVRFLLRQHTAYTSVNACVRCVVQKDLLDEDEDGSSTVVAGDGLQVTGDDGKVVEGGGGGSGGAGGDDEDEEAAAARAQAAADGMPLDEEPEEEGAGVDDYTEKYSDDDEDGGDAFGDDGMSGCFYGLLRASSAPASTQFRLVCAAGRWRYDVT
jgi:hypothetical protein